MFKRGQAQQFNWIFIAVVGIIILLFFLGFLVKYIDLQDSKKNAEIARSFSNSILSVKGTTQYKNFSVSQPFEVDYDCENLIINKDQKFRMSHSLLIDNFNTNKLVFWVEEYKKGFLIDRAVFISDADLAYYFEDSNYLVGLPPNVKIANSVQSADIIIGSSGVDYPNKKDIFIDPSAGIIKFVDEGETFYLGSDFGDFFVYAAAFSNAKIFNCTKEKLDGNFDRLKELYGYKIEQISLGQVGICNYNLIRNAVSVGDIDQMIELNNNLANLNCEVVF
jgi:hypothetical protein